MRILGKIIHGLFVTLLVGVAALLLVTLVPVTGNIEIKIVKSGSMEPTIPTGSLVLVVPSRSYHVGDVVTFGKDTKTEIPTTHRIVSVREHVSGNFYTTKGDANEEADPREIAAKEIIGKVFVHVPYVGYILDFARQPIGFALLIGVPAAMIVIDESITIYREIVRLRRRRKAVQAPMAPIYMDVPQKPQVFRSRIPTL